MPSVFLSHNHRDKSVTRRIGRFLRAYGIDSWLDERELRIGTRLDPAIKAAIERVEAVVVVATGHAAASDWVGREIDFAEELDPPIPVIPLYIDDVTDHPSFGPHLGIQVRSRFHFEAALRQLAEGLLGRPLPEPDHSELENDLEELAEEDSRIGYLIESCRLSEPLDQIRTVAQADFHRLDHALSVLSVLQPDPVVRSHTASVFPMSGAGMDALRRFVKMGHEEVLRSAIGIELDRALIPPALELLAAAAGRADQALSLFIWRNHKALDDLEAHQEVRELALHPHRSPDGFGADAAAAAFDLLPDSAELGHRWSGWIRENHFDHQSGAASLAHWCARGLRRGDKGWEDVLESWRRHLRSLMRSRTVEGVSAGVTHLREAADADLPELDVLIRECDGVSGTHEWKGWNQKERMGIVVRTFVEEARGERRWGAAKKRAREELEAVRDFENLHDLLDASGDTDRDD